jgi:hypothetical protein
MLDEANLLTACVTGSPEVLASELVRAMARLSPSAPPATVQLAKGVLDLALSMCSSPTVVRQLVECTLDQSQLWVPGTQATTAAAVVATQSTGSRGSKARLASPPESTATSDEVGPMFFSRFKDVIASWLVTAEGWRVAVSGLFQAMKSVAATGHNHPWSVLSALLDSCDSKPVPVVARSSAAPASSRKPPLRIQEAVEPVLAALPGLESWISDADVNPNVINDLIALLDRLGVLVPSLYVTIPSKHSDSARFLEAALRRLFSDAIPVPVKVCRLQRFCLLVHDGDVLHRL